MFLNPHKISTQSIHNFVNNTNTKTTKEQTATCTNLLPISVDRNITP